MRILGLYETVPAEMIEADEGAGGRLVEDLRKQLFGTILSMSIVITLMHLFLPFCLSFV